jgi:hypothetical protein
MFSIYTIIDILMIELNIRQTEVLQRLGFEIRGSRDQGLISIIDKSSSQRRTSNIFMWT